jgi:hypothetical protein
MFKNLLLSEDEDDSRDQIGKHGQQYPEPLWRYVWIPGSRLGWLLEWVSCLGIPILNLYYSLQIFY